MFVSVKFPTCVHGLYRSFHVYVHIRRETAFVMGQKTLINTVEGTGENVLTRLKIKCCCSVLS